MNEYIATQSSDRSVKVYSLSHKHGAAIETHPVGSNTRMVMRGSRGHSRNGSTATANANGGRGGDHSRAPSLSRPSPRAGDGAGRSRAHVRRSSISSEASSVSIVPSHSGRETERERQNSNANMDAPLTPATSVASGFGGMFLPPSSAASTSGQRDSNIIPIKEYKEPRTAATSRRSSFSGSQAPGSPASFRGRTMEDRCFVTILCWAEF
jgi:chromatin assembly factor 1 subunit B